MVLLQYFQDLVRADPEDFAVEARWLPAGTRKVRGMSGWLRPKVMTEMLTRENANKVPILVASASSPRGINPAAVKTRPTSCSQSISATPNSATTARNSFR